jgi:hypothetical protein
VRDVDRLSPSAGTAGVATPTDRVRVVTGRCAPGVVDDSEVSRIKVPGGTGLYARNPGPTGVYRPSRAESSARTSSRAVASAATASSARESVRPAGASVRNPDHVAVRRAVHEREATKNVATTNVARALPASSSAVFHRMAIRHMVFSKVRGDA